MDDADLSADLVERVRAAHGEGTPLCIRGGGSKAFYGNRVDGATLDVGGHRGIIDYQPSELVLTARCGTPLAEIENVLAEHGQMLAFEPPRHTAQATFGGAIATGLSGPRRAFAGAARDFVLGTRVINGTGEDLGFGGRVMKNVAGYDASRLMVAAQGTLGVLLDISVKVLPRPEVEQTLVHECDEATAQRRLHDWINGGVPVCASSLHEGRLLLRLGSTHNSVRAARARIGGDDADAGHWRALRDQRHAVFENADLWRLSLPAACDTPDVSVKLVEWAGALRWAVSAHPLHELARELGGHATRYDLHAEDLADRFQPLPGGLMALHRRLKRAFDPAGILNPGRLYAGL